MVKRTLYPFLFFFILVKCAYSLEADDSYIIWPKKNSIYEEKYLSLVIRKPEKVNKIVVVLNEDNIFDKNISSKTIKHENIVFFSIKLEKKGSNKIVVKGFFDKEQIFDEQIEVFLKTVLNKKYRYPPKKFKRIFFHTQKYEKLCNECHDMSVNEIKGVVFHNSEDSNCYECHKFMSSEKYMHAPAANWLCATSCHTGQVGEFNEKYKGKSKFLYEDPIEPVCLSCHEKFKSRFFSEKYRHEPVDDGRCTKCHNPHGNNDKKFLRYEVWTLCTTCHADKKNQPHVVTTFSKKAHPTRGKKDPTDPTKELTCVSCHNPHVSNNGFMLKNYGGKGMMLWCARCHKK